MGVWELEGKYDIGVIMGLLEEQLLIGATPYVAAKGATFGELGG